MSNAGGNLPQKETVKAVKVKTVVHDVPADEGGGYWAEVPALPGCRTQGDSWDELIADIREVVEGWLLIDRESQFTQPLVELDKSQHTPLLCKHGNVDATSL
jgi:predicted RNase H-like HicB family nuclease